MLELGVAALLIAVNGLFSLSELALVSARRARLKVLAEGGRRGAAQALRLAEDPGRFLSTVQIGITLVGVLAGAFSGAALGASATAWLAGRGMPGWLAEPVGYGGILGLITYLSVVVGELVPKQLALRNPEAVACAVAPAMAGISRAAAPAVWLLDRSTRLVFRLVGGGAASEPAVTEQDVRTMVAEAATAGVIEGDEHRMISAVLRLGDRSVRAVMTPRPEVEWLDATADAAELLARVRAAGHSRLPVAEGAPDNVIGVLQLRDLARGALSGEPFDLRRHLREAPVLPDTLNALDALGALREAPVPFALVHDEYGNFEGVVTPADILDAIAGAFRSDEDEGDGDRPVQREDGSWLLPGWLPADEMADLLGLALPPRRDFQTVAGLVIGVLREFPATGATADALGWRFEVVDLDGRRIDKVLARPAADRGPAPSTGRGGA